MKAFKPSRLALIAALCVMALHSVLPLAGELMAQRGWISSASLQMVCSGTGIKFIKTAPLSADTVFAGTDIQTAPCPWCSLHGPALQPIALVIVLQLPVSERVAAPPMQQVLAQPPWLRAPARAPPPLV